MLPRGIRANNPGNIRRSTIGWRGQSVTQIDPSFVTFDAPEYGLRAVMKLMLTYFNKYNLNTIRLIIGRYAPPNENDTQAYINNVSTRANYPADKVIEDIDSLLIPLAQMITRHENGKPPAPDIPSYWYEDSVYIKAKEMAIS